MQAAFIEFLTQPPQGGRRVDSNPLMEINQVQLDDGNWEKLVKIFYAFPKAKTKQHLIVGCVKEMCLHLVFLAQKNPATLADLVKKLPILAEKINDSNLFLNRCHAFIEAIKTIYADKIAWTQDTIEKIIKRLSEDINARDTSIIIRARIVVILMEIFNDRDISCLAKIKSRLDGVYGVLRIANIDYKTAEDNLLKADPTDIKSKNKLIAKFDARYQEIKAIEGIRIKAQAIYDRAQAQPAIPQQPEMQQPMWQMQMLMQLMQQMQQMQQQQTTMAAAAASPAAAASNNGIFAAEYNASSSGVRSKRKASEGDKEDRSGKRRRLGSPATVPTLPPLTEEEENIALLLASMKKQ